MFGPGMNYAPPILQARNRDPRLQYFQALAQQGASTAPVQSGLEALARVGQAGIGGYFGGQVNKEYDERQKQYQDALQKALASEDPLMALQQAGNADVMSQFGPQILTAKTRQVERKEERADKLADRQATEAFTLQRDKAQQDWTLARDELQAAKQAALQNNSFENQMRLQRAQQSFAQEQMKSQQGFSADQQTKQQNFQSSENDKTRQAQQLPTGFRVTPQGLAPIPGGPADPAYLDEKNRASAANKMNDEQAKAASFADRMANAESILNSVGDIGTSAWERAKAAVPFAGNYAVSDNYQKMEQAQRDFVNAVLRRESGAVISPQEFDNAAKQYFPQPGDKADVLEQKRMNRETVIAGMARSAGSAYKPAPRPKPKDGWGIERIE